jgi:hypothetical protein
VGRALLAGRVVRPGPAAVVGGHGDHGAAVPGRARAARRRRDRAGRADHPGPRARRRPRTVPRTDADRGRDLVPAFQRARSRIGPGRPDDAGRARRRQVGRQRAEGVEHQRPPRRPRDPAGPDRLGRAQAPRHHLLRAPDAPARRGGQTSPADELPRLLQRGVPHRRHGAGRLGGRRGRPGLGGGAHHAGLRAALRRRRAALGPRRSRPGRLRGASRSGGALQDLRVVPAEGRPPRPGRIPRAGGRAVLRPGRGAARPAPRARSASWP